MRTRRNNTRQCEFIHAPTHPYGLVGRVEPGEVMIVIDERSSDVFVVTESGTIGIVFVSLLGEFSRVDWVNGRVISKREEIVS